MNISNQNTMTTGKFTSTGTGAGESDSSRGGRFGRTKKKYGMVASRDNRKPPPPKRKENQNAED
jgi:hypothetical protein